MMNGNKDQQRVNQWITSLAVAVVSCAMFSLLVAGRHRDMQKQLTVTAARTEMLEAELSALQSGVLWNLRRGKISSTPRDAGGAPGVSTPLPVDGNPANAGEGTKVQ